MSNETKNLPASIQGRLKNKAKIRGQIYAEVLQYYAMERFLYRLSKSEHCEKFALKGGLVFFGWGIELQRPTLDIDLEGFTSNQVENIVEMIKDVCMAAVEPDGIEFDPASVVGERIRETEEYQGVRVVFNAQIGKSLLRMRVDVGFSDWITPAPIPIDYPTLLDQQSPKLRGYTVETVVAEKLQAIVSLGIVNSRVKDFYDIWLLARHVEFRGPVLSRAVMTTFRHRNTNIPKEMPVGLSDRYIVEKQEEWAKFSRKFTMNKTRVPDFQTVVEELRQFLLPLLHASSEGAPFNFKWKSTDGWVAKK